MFGEIESIQTGGQPYSDTSMEEIILFTPKTCVVVVVVVIVVVVIVVVGLSNAQSV